MRPEAATGEGFFVLDPGVSTGAWFSSAAAWSGRNDLTEVLSLGCMSVLGPWLWAACLS